MTLIVISVKRDDLPEHTDKEFESWINYQVGALGGITMDNPLFNIDMEAKVEEWG